MYITLLKINSTNAITMLPIMAIINSPVPAANPAAIAQNKTPCL